VPQISATTRYGSIATPHALATDAGKAAYLNGGSAIDAALAAAAVLTVVYPHNTSLGGDGVSLVRAPDGTVSCINATGYAGENTSLDSLRERYGAALPVTGPDTITVPGLVRGWEEVRRHGARLSWNDQIAPAIPVAREGVAVAPSLARALHLAEDTLRRDDGASTIFFDAQGRLLEAGACLTQRALGATLATLAAEGPDSFYSGAIGHALVSGLRRAGCTLSQHDFEAFQPELTDALSGRRGDITVLTSPPNTQGFLLLRFLNLLADADDPMAALTRGAGDLAHLFDLGNELRDTQLADPAFAEIDLEALLHDELLSDYQASASVADPRVPRGDTVAIVAADSDGYAVSHVQSLFHHFGSAVLEPATGILMHNRATSFSLNTDSANRIAPGKRPSHSLMPVMVLKDEKLAWVNACMGGRAQAQIHAQLLLRQLGGKSCEETVAEPRFVVGPSLAGEAGDTVRAEEGLPQLTTESLVASHLPVITEPRFSERLGHANVIACTPDGGFDAASDPRSDGAAVVVELPAL
jgi:gamma-glutamyltranspeptidase / glutathione hydrolase